MQHDSSNLNNNPFLWAVVIVTVFNIMVFGVGTLIVNKTTNKVLETIKKKYSPSPYGPGFDPDKVDLDYFYDKKYEGHTNNKLGNINSYELPIVNYYNWENEWERERGF